ncbi:MAG: creatininase family protein [Planctomycetota bacterium]|jgi:creatinine amidohydrolase|nr:creatininase family protein [Planctomycetota bacterium]MDP7250550.1 creatininase family protein [Planctomycetota bacterium]
MSEEINVQKMTRREVREAMAEGKFNVAIIPTGAIEQHLEHLAMEHDIRSSTWVAQQAAQRLYPKAIVAVPMSIGISEHHMMHKGTLSAKPGSWMTVLFDAIECMARHGCKHILVLNGHGGHEQPVYGMLRQWQLYFQNVMPDVNLQFNSYWNLSRDEAEEVCETGIPGHATEYETSMALHLFPENVRHDAIEDSEAKLATAEKGEKFAEFAVAKTVEYVEGMLSGRFTEMTQHVWSRDLDPRVWDK